MRNLFSRTHATSSITITGGSASKFTFFKPAHPREFQEEARRERARSSSSPGGRIKQEGSLKSLLDITGNALAPLLVRSAFVRSSQDDDDGARAEREAGKQQQQVRSVPSWCRLITSLTWSASSRSPAWITTGRRRRRRQRERERKTERKKRRKIVQSPQKRVFRSLDRSRYVTGGLQL